MSLSKEQLQLLSEWYKLDDSDKRIIGELVSSLNKAKA